MVAGWVGVGGVGGGPHAPGRPQLVASGPIPSVHYPLNSLPQTLPAIRLNQIQLVGAMLSALAGSLLGGSPRYASPMALNAWEKPGGLFRECHVDPLPL